MMTDRYYHMSFCSSLFHCQKAESEEELEGLNESTLRKGHAGGGNRRDLK